MVGKCKVELKVEKPDDPVLDCDNDMVDCGDWGDTGEEEEQG